MSKKSKAIIYSAGGILLLYLLWMGANIYVTSKDFATPDKLRARYDTTWLQQYSNLFADSANLVKLKTTVFYKKYRDATNVVSVDYYHQRAAEELDSMLKQSPVTTR